PIGDRIDEITVEYYIASISEYLDTVYGYKPDEGVEGWTVYSPDWPHEQNTLKNLYVGRGYWINVRQACTLQSNSHHYELAAGWNLIGWLGP
ncbi:hypothetical protein ACFLWZ_07965, partial [Chloroflexota bacterium]